MPGFSRFATSGAQTVWEGGPEWSDRAIIEELGRLGIRSDVVVWFRVPDQPDWLSMILDYTTEGFEVKHHSYFNWPLVESMTEEEIFKIYEETYRNVYGTQGGIDA